MSLPAYNLYHDSGITWVDRLPQHWKVASLKWLSTRYSGGTPDKNRLDYWENGTIPWLNSGAVNTPIIEEPSAYITEEAFANSSAKWVPENALVMALAGQGKTKGMVAQVSFSTTCNQSMAAVIPDERLVARFLYWWLVTNYQNIRNMAGGDLRDGLNLELLGGISCPLPSATEQHSIVAFLDRETGKIDALIAEQEELLDLLAEKRQATISHAVTRGLNPNAPVKNSGVEWLGMVPEHWVKTPIKHTLHAIIDSEHKTAPFYEDGAYMVVRTSNIKNGELVLDDAKYTDIDGYTEWTARGRPEPGDIIFTREAPAGEACIVPAEFPVCLGQRTVLMKTDKARLNPYYGLWSIYGGLASEFVSVLAQGSTVSHFNMSDIGNIPVLLPPLEEQECIVSFINTELSKLNSLKVEANRAIALFRERRTALISAAVTGKIDVREHCSALAAAA